MIDLNHGSGPLLGQRARAAAPTSVTEAINARIDLALEARRAQQPERNYIGASELGDPCLRRIYYSATKADKKPFTGQKLRVFEMGHVFEVLVAVWIRAAGFELVTHDRQGRQFEFTTGHDRIKGHIDGVIIGGPAIPGLIYPTGWENKALKGSWWQKLVKNGLRAAEPKYFAQVQLYSGYFELGSFLLTAVNKDTAELYHEIIHYELAEAQRYSDRGVDLIRSVDALTPPPRIAAHRSFFVCRMCDYQELCWSVL